ncbi:MAG: hypothetical protein RID81_46340 [Sandaracinaceae bacterium]
MSAERGSPSQARARAPSHRLVAWTLAGLLLATTGLHAASWDDGFYNDDFFHLAVLEGRLAGVGRLDLFEFTAARPVSSAQGHLWPWWTSPDLRLRFFRPLTSVTLWVDHAIHGRWQPGYHVGNLVIWTLFVVVVVLGVRRLCARSGRGADAFLVAAACALANEAHALPVGWVTDRHALLPMVFVVGALLLHDTHRATRRRRWLVGASLAAAAALASSESGFAVFVWIAAYELASRDGWMARARRVAPYAVLALAYLATHGALGYGVDGLAYYADPIGAPASFLSSALSERLPLLTLGAATPLPADLALRVDAPTRALLLAGGWLLFALLGAWVWRRRADRTIAFVGAGVGMHLLFLCTSEPTDRGASLPVVGVAWLVATALSDARRKRGPRALSLAVAALAVGFALGPVQVARWQDLFGDANARRWSEAERAEWPRGMDSAHARVLFLHGSPDTAAGLVATRSALGLPELQAAWLLSMTPVADRLERVGPDSLIVHARPGETWLASARERSWMADPSTPLSPGDRFRVGALRVRIVSPAALHVSVDRDLDDPSVYLLAWDGARHRRLVAPPIGETGHVPVNATPR